MAAAGTAATLRAVPLDDAALMHTFMKLRGATDGRLTIGWMDAVNYAFIDGETWPMYRLLAATWQTFRKASDTLYESRTLEIAHFIDMQTGALLQKLTMPVSGAVVDVPAYRAGPSNGKVALRLDETRDFRMASETKDGASFFRTGKAVASAAGQPAGARGRPVQRARGPEHPHPAGDRGRARLLLPRMDDLEGAVEGPRRTRRSTACRPRSSTPPPPRGARG